MLAHRPHQTSANTDWATPSSARRLEEDRLESRPLEIPDDLGHAPEDEPGHPLCFLRRFKHEAVVRRWFLVGAAVVNPAPHAREPVAGRAELRHRDDGGEIAVQHRDVHTALGQASTLEEILELVDLLV